MTVALMASMTAGAQKNMKVQRQTEARIPKTAVTQAMQQRRVKQNAASAQLHVGMVKDNDYLSRIGGLNTGTRRVCSFFSPELLKKYTGCQVVGVRFAVASTSILGVSAWVSLDPSEGTYLATALASELVEGWNEVRFDTPYTITGKEEEMYVGYTFTGLSSSEYPILLGDGTGHEVYSFLAEDNGHFYDYSEYGCLAVQLVVEGDLPEYDIEFSNLTTNKHYYMSENDTLLFNVLLSNLGTKEIAKPTVEILLDGNLFGTLPISDTLETSLSLQYSFPIKNLNLPLGKHTFGMRATTFDNNKTFTEGTTEDDAVEANFAIYESSLSRTKTLIEFYTHTDDYYSPAAIEVLEASVKSRPDFIPVYIHTDIYGEEYPDELALEESDYYIYYFGLSQLPSIMFNRTVVPGYPYLMMPMNVSSSGYLNSFVDYVNSITPTFSTINITAALDEGGKNLLLTASGLRNGDFRNIFGNGALTVFLTEDSIQGTQGYYDGSSGNYGEVEYTHNHVLRKVVSEHPFGDEIVWTGLRFTKTYTVPVDESWNLDNMHAVAAIGKLFDDKALLDDFDVTNANDCSLRGLSDETGIIRIKDEPADNMMFDLSGRPTNGKVRGIYIQRNGNKTRKVAIR